MLDRIIQYSLRNRPAVLLGAVLLLLAGVYTAAQMDVDVFPDLNAPTVVVMTEAPGMAPEEVERLVTFPVETAVNGATDVRRVRSSSTTGFSVVWVEFAWGIDIYRARQIVSEKLAAVRGQLPPHAGNPTLGPQSSILGEVMILGLTAEHTSLQELRTLADWTIRPRLLAAGGVAQVTVLGGEVKEYQILLKPERLRHHGVSLGEVLAVTEGMNQNQAGGVLYEYGNEYIVRGVMSTQRIEDLERAVVRHTHGLPILLEHVAEVRVGSKSPQLGLASVEGQPAVLLTITKQPGASTIDLSARLDGLVADMRGSLPSDVRVSTEIFRQERFIRSAIDNVLKALCEGGVFVVVILFLFLMNARATLISLATIPLALVSALLVLRGMGLTINTMSLGGMAIAVGALVDDAIVDVENVYKRLRENRLLPWAERRATIRVVYEASREVRMPIFNSTLIIIASFAPLFFLSGMEGRMLAPLGIAFIVALFASTMVALTLTPVLCSYLLGRTVGRADASGEPWVARWLKRGYAACLGWSLRRRGWVLGGMGVALLISIAMLLSLGRSFLPPFNEGAFTVNVSTVPGISLEESDRIGRQAEQLLLSIPEILTTGRKTGRAELDEHAQGVNASEIEAPFALAGRPKEKVMEEMRAKLRSIPGVSIEIGQPISHRIDAMLSGSRANIAIKLFGTDLHRMFALGNQIKSAIEDVEGIADLNVEPQVDRPQLKIVPKREMLARYGMTLPEFARIVRVMLGGVVVSQVYEGNRAFDLTLRADDGSRGTMEQIRSLTVEANGRRMPLEHVAEVVSSSGPNMVSRENAVRKIVVSVNIAGRDLRGVVRDIQQRVDARVALPEGYHVEYGGQFESERAASLTLLVASVFSVLAIFMLLYHEIRSARQAAVILLNLPLAIMGGVVVIFFSSGILSIPAIIGFISLFGIATRNGMLLISRYNDLRALGLSVRESVLEGSLDRLNPILMTALTSALALIPLAVGGGLPGNEIQSPMARVILGGLLSSTVLNGFIVPIMYVLTCREAGGAAGVSGRTTD